MKKEYKKGIVELCVLSMMMKKDNYGYEITDHLVKTINVSDGTVYPVLRKLKKDGLLETYLQEVSGGPPRKYYKITKLGIEVYHNDKNDWLEFAQTIIGFLEE